MKKILILFVLVFESCTLFAQNDPLKKKAPEKIPGLLCFWDFQEDIGMDRVSKGKYNYILEEMNGPIKTINDGPFGGKSVDFDWGQWFRVKRANSGGLNLHGTDQQLTMVIWLQRESDRVWQYLAGIWSEGDKQFLGKANGEGLRAPARQYAMFINGYWQNDYKTYERSRAENQAMGYLSPYGGATPEHPFAFDYATGGTKLEKDRWYMLAFTYDGNWLKVYVDGKLDANANFNPFRYDGPIYDGGENGADFTIAQRNHPKWPTYPKGKPNYNEGFDGKLGGLAIYDRSISDKEVLELYQETLGGNGK